MFLRSFTLLFVGCFIFSTTGFAAPSKAGDNENTEVMTVPSKPAADSFAADFDADFGNIDVTIKDRLIADPLQPFNRGAFWVNDKLYFYLFKPVARGFRLALPRPARVSIENVFSNLAAPVRAGNALLQLKFRDFGTEVYRFVINTTFGIGGLFDPAKSIAGVDSSREDFGQTLGFYGVGHGFYLVLPIVGPTSLRDVTGSFVDSFADPFHYTDIDSLELFSVRMFDAQNRLSLDRDTYEGIIRDTIDPYLFIRAAYAQRRLAQVGENTYNLNLLHVPLFDDDFFSPFEWLGF